MLQKTRFETANTIGSAVADRRDARIPAGWAVDRGDLGSRTLLVMALVFTPVAQAFVANAACAPETTFGQRAHPTGLDKYFAPPTLGIRG